MRMCRREAKELLVVDTGGRTPGTTDTATPTGALHDAQYAKLEAIGVIGTIELAKAGRAIIGGGCCVSLSVEYMPSDPSLANDQIAKVAVAVRDSAGTVLRWGREFKEGYHVQECIITTYPGALLVVTVDNAIARVRWCEVFSC